VRESAFQIAAVLFVVFACGRGQQTEEAAGGPAVDLPPAGSLPVDAGFADAGLPPAPTDDAQFAALLPKVPPSQADDPAVCSPTILPHPDLEPQPDRPCTVEDGNGKTAYRYDATGRVMYRAVHSTYGYEGVFTSEDRGDLRIDTLVEGGRTSTQDVLRFEDGKPAEADHFTAAADGGLVLTSRSTWLNDASGRPQYVVTDYTNGVGRVIERHLYDSNGREYFVDSSQQFAGETKIVLHRWTFRSWYANGRLNEQVTTCGDAVSPPPGHNYDCGKLERRWDACGNLTYSADESTNGRHSRWVEWSWDATGRPRSRHDRWTTVVDGFESLETYEADGTGRAESAAIHTTNSPYVYLPPSEDHQATYVYDDAGHVTDQLIDGRTRFHAGFDAQGRVIERTGPDVAGYTTTHTWTYEGCGR